jgi:hypothetical protein
MVRQRGRELSRCSCSYLDQSNYLERKDYPSQTLESIESRVGDGFKSAGTAVLSCGESGRGVIRGGSKQVGVSGA